MESVRQQKVAKLIQKELAEIFRLEGQGMFRGIMISVTVVRMSPDLGVAKVYLSIFGGDGKEVMDKIETNNWQFRRDLGRKTGKQLRVVPELHFYLDDSMDYVEKIDKLLDS